VAPTGNDHPFVWTEHPQYGFPAGPTDLGTLGGTFGDAQGINVIGEITGGSFTASSPFSNQAYLWLPATAFGMSPGMHGLGSLGGTQVGSRGEAINDEAQITGTSFGGNPGDQTAFLYVPVADLGFGPGMHSLGKLGGASSFGADLNAHGEVVGRSTTSGGTMHAFLWLPSAKYGLSAGLNDLSPAATVFAEATALNDLGEVAGTELTLGFASRATLWLPSPHYGLPAGWNTLTTLAPHPDVAALDVNAHGMIVGYAATSTGVQLAALWENGAWTDLNTLVAPGSGWTLDVANAINDAGDIAGRGTFAGGSRAFLLRRVSTPPLVTYCTAKTTSTGCVPIIDGHGVSSVANGASFQVTCIALRNQKSGLFVYGSSGRAGLPFGGGTLCVKSPLKRTPLSNSAGNAAPLNDCSGVLQLDFNAFAAGLAGGNPSPALAVPGTTIDVQAWGRDAGFAPPNNVQLSGGLEYVVLP
jgi:probable HAF family extracellular repeat protein